MIDAQTVRGGRAGPTFHNAGDRGGRTIDTTRSILVEIVGLPPAVRVDPAKPRDVRVGREQVPGETRAAYSVPPAPSSGLLPAGAEMGDLD